jgi:hypothetical protein
MLPTPAETEKCGDNVRRLSVIGLSDRVPAGSPRQPFAFCGDRLGLSESGVSFGKQRRVIFNERRSLSGASTKLVAQDTTTTAALSGTVTLNACVAPPLLKAASPE